MNAMNKGVNTFFVSFIALILASPIAGVTSSFVFSDSQFSSMIYLIFRVRVMP